MVLLAVPLLDAELVVLEPPSYAGLTLKTSTYEFFGPKTASLDLEALFISGADLCSPDFQGINVTSRMVIADRSETECLMTELYPKLQAAGASALVRVVGWNPPGYLAFYHNTWEECAFCDDPMTLVETVDPDGVLEELGGIQSTTLIRIHLGPKHDRSYRTLFKSWAWVIMMQILSPLFAWWTSYLAGVHLLRTYRHGSKAMNVDVLVVICLVECPTTFLIGAAFICGQFGPNMLPMFIHAGFFSLLTGASIWTTLLLVLFLREENNHARTRIPRRSIFDLHRSLIWSSALFTLLWDAQSFVLGTLMGTWNMPTTIWNLVLGILFVVQIPLQATIALYFLSKGLTFWGPLRLYLSKLMSRLPGDHLDEYPETLLRVGRLTFWLSVSSICMLVTSTCGVFLILSYTRSSKGPKNIELDLLIVFMWTMSRVGVSFAQVKALVRKKNIRAQKPSNKDDSIRDIELFSAGGGSVQVRPLPRTP